ncbi:MAG: GNAT family N-acetyltransferase [Burkholderiales bacterium]|nr:GNAT family N-acetyltransferase [Burkholderiales bacterium]
MNSVVENPPTLLTTDRLTIRRLSKDDAQAYFAIFSDPAVMRYWGSPPLADLTEAEQKVVGILAHYEKGDLFQLAIERQSDRQMIGTCTLYQIHLQNRRAEVGYALGSVFWGNGYLVEAMHALIDHAFGPMHLHRLEADIDPRNEASAKSLERLGFKREGHLRERWIVGGEVSDSALYGLLASEWANPSPSGFKPNFNFK